MTRPYEELDVQDTPLGQLVLRRRQSPTVPDRPVHEVTLDGAMLMSSVVNASERALAEMALGLLAGRPCRVLIGGLGLGYTAAAALAFKHVRELVVVELLAPVIAWHRDRRVPMAATLMDDTRCRLVLADFFATVGPDAPAERYDAILLDIDHAPESWLHPRHAAFYTPEGLTAMAGHLTGGGVAAIWSYVAPDAAFLEMLRAAFPSVECRPVSFYNPHLSAMDTNWIVLAVMPQGDQA